MSKIHGQCRYQPYNITSPSNDYKITKERRETPRRPITQRKGDRIQGMNSRKRGQLDEEVLAGERQESKPPRIDIIRDFIKDERRSREGNEGTRRGGKQEQKDNDIRQQQTQLWTMEVEQVEESLGSINGAKEWAQIF